MTVRSTVMIVVVSVRTVIGIRRGVSTVRGIAGIVRRSVGMTGRVVVGIGIGTIVVGSVVRSTGTTVPAVGLQGIVRRSTVMIVVVSVRTVIGIRRGVSTVRGTGGIVRRSVVRAVRVPMVTGVTVWGVALRESVRRSVGMTGRVVVGIGIGTIVVGSVVRSTGTTVPAVGLTVTGTAASAVKAAPAAVTAVMNRAVAATTRRRRESVRSCLRSLRTSPPRSSTRRFARNCALSPSTSPI
ncbi:hypothetical protein [Planomonospora sphaerica]|uniref:hypothetical protein n=1 Tax=Planomonospora sphaerica TaxID=161355 RepID=UPI0018D12767|nr:hypothetical protein [Planomonospora sphaerica]